MNIVLKIIILQICGSQVKRGWGFRKFSSTLLEDLEYVVEIMKVLEEGTVDSSAKQLDGMGYIKTKTRGFTITYSSQKRKERREFKLNLEYEPCNIENELHDSGSTSNVERYQYIKEEMKKKNRRAKNKLFWSKVRKGAIL